MEQPAVTIIDSAATVRLSGEFAMQATFTNEPALEQVLTLPSVDRVLLDLSALSFIDSKASTRKKTATGGSKAKSTGKAKRT